jgi:hypothetical protein
MTAPVAPPTIAPAAAPPGRKGSAGDPQRKCSLLKVAVLMGANGFGQRPLPGLPDARRHAGRDRRDWFRFRPLEGIIARSSLLVRLFQLQARDVFRERQDPRANEWLIVPRKGPPGEVVLLRL